MDVHSQQVRSFNMSRIHSTNTKPEEIVRKFLFARGFRYRKNDKKLIGHPDIVLPKYKTIIFVNGCFWHVHEGCKHFVWPKSNEEFWLNKLNKNKLRDETVRAKLINEGWNVIVIWECELKSETREKTLYQLEEKIYGR